MIARTRQHAARMACHWVAETMIGLVGTGDLIQRLAMEANDLLMCGVTEDELQLTGLDDSIASDGESVLGLDWHVHPTMFG